MNDLPYKIETDLPEPAPRPTPQSRPALYVVGGKSNWAPVPGPLSEDLVAVEFVERYGDDVRFDHTAKSWFIWNGVRWKRDEIGTALARIRDLSRDLARGKGESTEKSAGRATFSRGVEEHARHDQRIAVTSDLWDSDAYLLGTPSGVLDLRQGEHRNARREDYITKQAAVAPSDTTDCARWFQFLDEATGGDADLKRFLQRWAGYCLTGETSQQALVYLHGPGGNGKSVFVNTLSDIMADYAQSAGMETFTASPFDRHPEELARLAGARLVSASETEANRHWAESRIKQLTGGDKIAARFMRMNSFEFRPQFKLTLLGNHAPAISNLDDAIRRRFIIVPFTRKPPQVDLKLEEKLQAEWPGILRWAAEGARDWIENGLILPDAITKATADYFDDQDLFGQWLDECCRVEHDNDSLVAKSTALFGSWSDFAERHGEKNGTQRSFNETMRHHGFAGPVKRRFADGTNTKAFAGIELRPRFVPADDP
jgi:putative DNA primase/helicase